MPRSPAYQGLRSRHELLATRVMSSDEFLRSTEAYGPNGVVHPRESLSPIAVVLQPNETVDEYEWSFQEWLERQEVTSSMLENDPEEERRLRQCFVYSRVQSSDSKGRTSDAPGCKRRRVTVDDEPGRSDKSEQNVSPWSKYAGDLAQQLTEMEDRINAQFAEMKQELRGLRQREERRESTVPVKSESASQPARNASIYTFARELMSRAMQLDSDGTQKRLVEVYTHFNEKATKMKTSLRDAGEAGRDLQINLKSECQDQLSTDERRRDAALAAVVAHEWNTKQCELYQAFDHPDQAENESDMHEKLEASYKKSDLLNDEVQRLQIKLRNRLSWLEGVNVTDTKRNAQFEELLEVSNALSAKFVVMSRIQGKRRALCIKMLQANQAIRSEVIQLMENAQLRKKNVSSTLSSESYTGKVYA